MRLTFFNPYALSYEIEYTTIFFIRNTNGLKCFLDFAHFLAEIVSYQFLIFGGNKEFWSKMGQIILKRSIRHFPKKFLRYLNQAYKVSKRTGFLYFTDINFREYTLSRMGPVKNFSGINFRDRGKFRLNFLIFMPILTIFLYFSLIFRE